MTVFYGKSGREVGRLKGATIITRFDKIIEVVENGELLHEGVSVGALIDGVIYKASDGSPDASAYWGKGVRR